MTGVNREAQQCARRKERGMSENEESTISRACDMAIANGTGLIKTNNTWGPLSVEVVEGLKRKYAGRLDLMGRKAENPVRRGPTRLKQLMEAGVNCCYASDNIRDAWRPYGNADMMQEAMVAAHCMQYAFPDELEVVWRMGTYNAAKNALVEGYGVEEGCNADLVVLDAPSADLALIGQARKLYVVKGGKVVAKDGVLL